MKDFDVKVKYLHNKLQNYMFWQQFGTFKYTTKKKNWKNGNFAKISKLRICVYKLIENYAGDVKLVSLTLSQKLLLPYKLTFSVVKNFIF